MKIKAKPIAVVVAILFALPMCAQTVEEFVVSQLKKYPCSKLIDIYKSCFQDYMGAEHLIDNVESVRNYLDYELSVCDSLQMPYYEPCGVDGRHYRVGLRCVKEGLIRRESLLDAFVESANNFEHPTVESWKDKWHEIVSVIKEMNLEIVGYEADYSYIESVLASGHYAISHSSAYKKAYNPHYRIVERSIFEQRILPLLDKSAEIGR